MEPTKIIDFFSQKKHRQNLMFEVCVLISRLMKNRLVHHVDKEINARNESSPVENGCVA